MAKKRKSLADGPEPAAKQQRKPNNAPAAAAAAAAPPAAVAAPQQGFRNKERVLVLATRGIAFRARHFMADLASLLPHHKKDVKLDTKNERAVVNEVAELKVKRTMGGSLGVYVCNISLWWRRLRWLRWLRWPRPAICMRRGGGKTSGSKKVPSCHLNATLRTTPKHRPTHCPPKHTHTHCTQKTHTLHTQKRKQQQNCTSALFFEGRKRHDLYLWMAKTPGGPTAKFLVQNVHTMDELKLTGNHLKGSRPVLSFDASFDGEPHLQLVKEMLTHVFATPRRHHRSKPFFDHVVSFTWADGRVWMRNYQVVLPLDKKRADASNATLVEVGPRAAFQPIRIFEGAFGGPVAYENPEYVAPNAVRAMQKRKLAGKYAAKVSARGKRRAHEAANPRAPGAAEALRDVFRE